MHGEVCRQVIRQADLTCVRENPLNSFNNSFVYELASCPLQTVNVYRLITSNTIEEKIMKLQSIKMEVSNAIVNSDNSTMYSMGTDRMLDLFTFTEENAESSRKIASVGATMQSNLLDSILSQEEEYASLSTQSFLHDLFSIKHSTSTST